MNTQELKNNVYGVVYRTADTTLLHNNANKASERIPVMRDFVAGEVSKYLASQDETLIPKDVYEAHIRGDLHWHDLDYSPLFPMVNCCLVDLRNMLTYGFKMGGAEIDTPKSITTATAVTSQIIAQVASHIYGKLYCRG